MNLNFYHPNTTSSLENLQSTLQDQLTKLDQLSKLDLTPKSPQPIQPQQQRYYLDCGLKEEWDQFLKLNYGITENQIFEDYRLFLQAKAELNEDKNKEKLEDMKRRLSTPKEAGKTNISSNPQPNYQQPIPNEQMTPNQINPNYINYNQNAQPINEVPVNASSTTIIHDQYVNGNNVQKLEENTSNFKGKGSKHAR